MNVSPPTGASHHKNLHETRPRRITPHVTTQLVDQRVVNHRQVVVVGRVKNPIRFRGKAGQRKMLLFVELVHELHRKRRLTKSGGGRATHVEPRARSKRGRVRKRRLLKITSLAVSS